MSDLFVTMMELAKLKGSDAEIGLIEEVTTHAPEIDVLSGRVIRGVSYKYSARKTLPTKPAFRNVNEGSDIVSSRYEQKIGECFYLDAQMQVDEAIVKADGGELGGILALESIGIVRQKMIALGSQFYEGKTADAKGFYGLKALYDSSMEVSAGGSSGAATSAWLVWNDIQGIHWIFGNNQAPTLGEWVLQQVKDSSSRAFRAWVNNLSGYIGLAAGHTKAVGRIKLITSAKPLTDELIAEAISKFPIGMRPTHLFCNRNAAFWLQKSRATMSSSGVPQNQGGTPLVFPGQPVESNGVKIHVTDSIPQTE